MNGTTEATMSKKNVDKIKDKISKLLAKANGTENKAEAAAFMAKVEELLEQHQLEIGDVVKTDPLERTIVFVAPITPRDWQRMVPNIVCQYFGCKMFTQRQRQATLCVAVGRESTRVTTELMLPFILEQLREQAAEYRKKTLFSSRKAMDDVCAAFVIRVNQLIHARRTVAEAHGSKERALVLIDEADAWMNEHMADLKKGKAVNLETNALAAEYADRVKLDRNLGGNTAGGQLLLGAA